MGSSAGPGGGSWGSQDGLGPGLNDGSREGMWGAFLRKGAGQQVGGRGSGQWLFSFNGLITSMPEPVCPSGLSAGSEGAEAWSGG